jgi:S-adenosylmethionine decarboxylase
VFFEGSEKKFELALDPASPALPRKDVEFWDGVIGAARADRLSRMSNELCEAFLLSESSLFVFDHKVLMITCGRTTLLGAVQKILHSINLEAVRLFFYERKNELYPYHQSSCFFDDIRVLNQMMQGRAYLFGCEDSHHINLFHLDRPAEAEPEDATLEVLMYGLDDGVRPLFSLGMEGDRERVRQESGLDGMLPGYQLDDYLFDPAGYSLNGIKGEYYYTIHVTPESLGSYASFETNDPEVVENRQRLIGRVLEIFRPRSFDLMLFSQDRDFSYPHKNFTPNVRVHQGLVCGYQVHYSSFIQPALQPGAAVPLLLEE